MLVMLPDSEPISIARAVALVLPAAMIVIRPLFTTLPVIVETLKPSATALPERVEADAFSVSASAKLPESLVPTRTPRALAKLLAVALTVIGPLLTMVPMKVATLAEIEMPRPDADQATSRAAARPASSAITASVVRTRQ